jgi:ADP-heptose:LPS heptosyltransferase
MAQGVPSGVEGRFLIVRLGSMGDVIHAIPAAASLRARYPGARIDWLIDPRYAALLQLVRGVDQAIPINTRGSMGTLLRTIRRLREARYDAAVDLQGLIKSGALARAAGARRTIGFPRERLREPIARVFYTETPDPGRDAHVILKNLGLMRALGVEDVRVMFPLQVPRTPAGDSVAAAFGPGGRRRDSAPWPPEFARGSACDRSCCGARGRRTSHRSWLLLRRDAPTSRPRRALSICSPLPRARG